MKKILLFVSLCSLTACSHTESARTPTPTANPASAHVRANELPQPVTPQATLQSPQQVELQPLPNSAIPSKLSDVRGEILKRSRNLGFPLAGEKLEIIGEDGTNIVASTQSESDGSFHFKGDFSSGHYLLRLVSEKFKAPEMSFSKESYPAKGLRIFAEVK